MIYICLIGGTGHVALYIPPGAPMVTLPTNVPEITHGSVEVGGGRVSSLSG